MKPMHGGPDAQGVPRWDFSTNANACGPCPMAQAAVSQADARYYPDPAYTSLRDTLAAFHQVDARRIVFAASASEFITRITAWAAREGGRQVWLPTHAYGDYAQAAWAWGLARVAEPSDARLAWVCEPSSPLGVQEPEAARVLASDAILVLDRAYEPLRLQGTPRAGEQAWQLWTPNKALGLTGVRGAYAIAPAGATEAAQALDSLAPSWPLGAHAVALLQSWAGPAAQDWLAHSRERLRDWKTQQIQMLHHLGWRCAPSDTNFFCAHPPAPLDAAALRAQGVKLRDATSFGLPGHWRLSVQPPQAQQALREALQ